MKFRYLPMTEEDRRITAIHEAGHALVAKLLPNAEPVHKVTIIPRGVALGATLQMPDKDRYHMQREYVKTQVKVLFAFARHVFFVFSAIIGCRPG